MDRSVTPLYPRLVLPGLAWAALAVGIHKVGVFAGYYGAYPWFQNVTHAASASGVAVLVAIFGLHLGVRGRRLVALAVVGTALGAVAWEVVEYLGLLDQFGMYFHFHDLNDAAVDMASNAVGTTVALVALWAWTGLEPPSDHGSERTSTTGSAVTGGHDEE